MPLSESNRADLLIIAESTWGTTPTTPTMIRIPYTSEGLKTTREAVSSESIRTGRNVLDLVHVGGGADGPISFEMRYADYEPLFESAFYSTFTALDIQGTNLALTGATITDSGNGFGSVVVGQWVRISESNTSANDGDYKVTASAAGTLTLEDEAGSAASFTADSSNANLHVTGRYIRNGVAQKPFSIEKGHVDISRYRLFTGMVVSTLSFDITSRSKQMGSFEFIGKGMTESGATTASAVTDSSSNQIMNASNHVGRFKVGALTAALKSLSLNVSNNLRAQDVVGASDNAGVGAGTFMVTGNMSLYLQDGTFLSQFLTEIANYYDTKVTDPGGNSMVITLPRLKFSSEDAPVGGENTDVMESLAFQAIVDSGGTYTMQLDMLDAPTG